MYTRSDGKMTGNHQQGRHFDRMSGAGGVQSRGSGGGKSKESMPRGEADLAAGAHEETQAHPVTGVHEVHIKHHGDGHFTVHTFHNAIGAHPQAHEATASQHHGESDMHGQVQSSFPNDGDETGMEPGAETLSGITGGMPGQNSEGPNRRGY